MTLWMSGCRNVFGRAVPSAAGSAGELVCWRPVCHLFGIIDALGRNHGKWASNLNLSPFRYTAPPRGFLLYIKALSAFICLPAFPYPPSFHRLITSGLPSTISLPQTGGERRGWRGLKDTRFQQVSSEKNTLVRPSVSKGLESEFGPS